MISVEQYAAFTSSVFAGLTLWLAYKTKSLTDVVVELKEQTNLLNKRYDLERQLSIRDRLPDFEITDFCKTDPHTWRMEFTNRGQFATHFFIKGESNGFENLAVGDYAKIADKKILFLFAKMTEIFDDRKKINFNFNLWYKNGNGTPMMQYVNCVEGHINITPQTDAKDLNPITQ